MGLKIRILMASWRVMAAPSLDGCVFLLALLLINVSAFAGKTLLFALSVSAGADECRRGAGLVLRVAGSAGQGKYPVGMMENTG
ncbi:MAG: hypothetical protein AB1461_04275 [Thermodesulfobacteriota bacterium]